MGMRWDMGSEMRRARKALVLVNNRAGTVLEKGHETFEGEIVRLFGLNGVEAEVAGVDPGAFAETFAAKTDRDGFDLIVLAGGDGTVNAALPHLTSDAPPVAVLPLGTYNLIGRDLGTAADLPSAVAAIAAGSPVRVDLGQVNDRLFHSKVGLGWFVKVAQERQEARRRFPFSKLAGTAFALAKALVHSRSIRISYDVAGEVRETTAVAVLVTNNRFDPDTIARPRLNEGLLELHFVSAPTILSRLRTLLAVARGRWRELPNVQSVATDRAIITLRGRRSGRVAVDGEIVRMGFPLTLASRPRAAELVAGGTGTGGQT
jgi:diacylglycerol kinase family enzyme